MIHGMRTSIGACLHFFAGCTCAILGWGYYAGYVARHHGVHVAILDLYGCMQILGVCASIGLSLFWVGCAILEWGLGMGYVARAQYLACVPRILVYCYI